MTFCSIVGHASFHTAEASGRRRSNDRMLQVSPSYPTSRDRCARCSRSPASPDLCAVPCSSAAISSGDRGPRRSARFPGPDGPPDPHRHLSDDPHGVVQGRRSPKRPGPSCRSRPPERPAVVAGSRPFMTALAASIGTGISPASRRDRLRRPGPSGLGRTDSSRWRSIRGGRPRHEFPWRAPAAVRRGPMYYFETAWRAPIAGRGLCRGCRAGGASPRRRSRAELDGVVLKSQFSVPTWAAGIAIAVLTWS